MVSGSVLSVSLDTVWLLSLAVVPALPLFVPVLPLLSAGVLLELLPLFELLLSPEGVLSGFVKSTVCQYASFSSVSSTSENLKPES